MVPTSFLAPFPILMVTHSIHEIHGVHTSIEFDSRERFSENINDIILWENIRDFDQAPIDIILHKVILNINMFHMSMICEIFSM